MTPQLIYLGLSLLGIGIALEQHGKPKTGHHSFWSTLFGSGLAFVVLYWGGFFDVLME